MRNARKFLYVACFCGALFGCGGGGSGGSMGMSADNGDNGDDIPPTINTPEFRANYGLRNIRAAGAYEAGAFGQGVTVAVADSGVLTSHIDLQQNIVAGYDFFDDTNTITDTAGHGTAVAGVIGARRGNGGVHGVAPSARIMPLRVGNELVIPSTLFFNNIAIIPEIVSQAVDNGAQIINASFGENGYPIYGRYQGQNYWLRVPGIAPFIAPDSNDDYTNAANAFADAVRGEDVVVVWAAGNDGWRPGGRIGLQDARCNDATNPECFPAIDIRTPISPSDLTDFDTLNYTDQFGDSLSGSDDFDSALINFATSPSSSYESSIPLWAVENFSQLALNLANGDITEAEFEAALAADPDFVSTAPRWLAVVATDENNRIASFSNGCGLSLIWCIAAPGIRISTTHNNGRYTETDGTSFAAPHVSGALAVLKSAAPELPMTVIQFALLTTATDLGEPGVDDVYGWGLVNLDAGISLVAGLQTPSGVLLSDMREGMPAEFSHLRGRLDGVSVAVEVVDGAYHNVALSEFARGGGGKNSYLGDAAKEMAAADYAAGESFRFWGGLDYDDSRSSFIGESDSVFSAANASDTNGWIRWTTADYGGLSAFGEWSHTQIDADYDSAAFIAGIENARADGWTAGFRYADLFMHNDALQISARQESRLSGGEMVLRYPVAAGDFYEAFLGESEQTIRTEEARIPLKRKAETIWTAGYSQQTDGGDWTAAMEWNAATNAKALSAEWRIRF